MKFHIVKTLGGFKLAFDSDYEAAKKIPLNEPFEVEYKKQRNVKFHRKFFALVKMVYENQERYSNIDHLRKDLTIEAGFYQVRYNLQGVEIYEPKSISFASMDEIEFNEFYSRVVDVIVRVFHFDKDDIAEHIEQYF